MTATVEIVLGPPGTGKTTELLRLVDEELSRGVPPEQVGYVSFTRRAADEAVQRATAKFGFRRDQLPYFRTLHSLCFAKLGLSRKDVLEGDRLQEFADYARIRLTGRVAEDGTLQGDSPGDRAMQVSNLARIRRVPLRQAYEDLKDDQPFGEIQRLDVALRAYKQEHGLLDFTDMLEQFVAAGLPSHLRSLFVDEGQDLSELQWLVVDGLWRGAERRVVAGDDDQAIYRWAGAAVEHLIDLQGSSRVLARSYRVPQRVQALAAGIIGRVHLRRAKQWQARDADGVVEKVGDLGKVDFHAGTGTVLVLVRNVFLLRERVFPTLRTAGVVYEYEGHPSIPDKLLAAVRAWERMRGGSTVTVAEARHVYEYMSVGQGFKRGHKLLPGWPDELQEVGMGDLQRHGGLLRTDHWYTALDKISRFDVAYIGTVRRRGDTLRGKPRVRVSTIHGSKGGEADHVVLLLDMAQRTHREMRVGQVAEDDERRVWYVAVTRAKERLTIVAPRTKMYCPWL